MANIDINKIAKFITSDPDIFNEENKPSGKAKKTNKPEEGEFDKEFEDLLGIEHKDEPADPSKKDRNQKSPNNELSGATQSGKPYLESPQGGGQGRLDERYQPGQKPKTIPGLGAGRKPPNCDKCGTPKTCPKCG